MTQTTQINYAMYWHSNMWPSDSNRDAIGQPTLVPIDSIAPQQAASSLAKLIRWVHQSPVGELLTVDVDGREDYARHTLLARTLSARALSLTVVDDLFALFGDRGDAPRRDRAEVITVLGDVFSQLLESHPLANHADLGTVAAMITGDLCGRYELIPKE